MAWLAYILISTVFAVGGQVLLKRGVADLGPLALAPHTLVPTVRHVAGSPLIVAGVAAYVGGTFFWLLALSRVELSYAYPFVSLNYIFILFASWLVFHEAPSVRRFLGVAIICVGIATVARTGRGDKRSPVRVLAAETDTDS